MKDPIFTIRYYSVIMKYWDWILDAQERMTKSYPSGEKGLTAINFIRNFFEKMGADKLDRYHPLHYRLTSGAEPNYLWLIQYAQKLHTASMIPGFEQIVKRLSDPETYLSVNNEIEVSLKMYLAGLNVSFVPTSNVHPTPDLLVKMPDKEITIEVSSLNPSNEEEYLQTLQTRLIMLILKHRLVYGALVNRVSDKPTLERILTEVEAAIENILETNKTEKVNIPGVITIYLAPPEKIDDIPEECKNSSYYVQPPRRSLEDKIKRKINEKYSQLTLAGEAGLLYLYTQMIPIERIFQQFEKPFDQLNIVLASYPKLSGLILTRPHFEIERIVMMKYDMLKSKTKKGKAYIETEAGAFQYESTLTWDNEYANQSFPQQIIEAIKNYQNNLEKLSPLELV